MTAEHSFGLINSESSTRPSVDYNKIRIGRTVLKDDAFIDLDYLKPKQRRMKRADIERAIDRQDLDKIRDISLYFYYSNGIYERLCRYMAYLYRYDWYVTPIKYDDNIKDIKVIEGWYKASKFLDNSNLKKAFGEIALKVIRDGCFYGYTIKQKNASYIQQLPIKYCRSRYSLNGRAVVEFNVKYFDDAFADVAYREKVLKLFPIEFRKAYLSYKKDNLPRDPKTDEKGWFVLDTSCAFKFNLNGSDFPLFIAVIPKLLDLEDAQDLDKKRMAQQLLRLVIQEMPLDKNFEPVFDVPEIQAFHNNAVQMVGDAVGMSVLTTLANVKVEDLSDGALTSAAADQLEKIERTVYNEAGVSQMQFNTDGNLALEKSIANDEATMMDLLLQFEDYAEGLLDFVNKNINRLHYKVSMLPTTIYNYKDLAKVYKEQTTLGFSKLLPQVALGHPQSVVMATAYFENDILHLEEVFIPPQSSNTIGGNVQKDTDSPSPEGGRPALDDDQKAEKTIVNKESAN